MSTSTPLPAQRDDQGDSRTTIAPFFSSRPSERKAMRTPLGTPLGTPDTEAMTPMTATPMSSMSFHVSTSRSDLELRDGFLGDLNPQSPEDEWRIRTLFPDEDGNSPPSDQSLKKCESLPSPIMDRPEPDMHSSSSLSLQHAPLSSTSLRNKSKSTAKRVKNAVDEDSRPGAFGIPERRRSAITTTFRNAKTFTSPIVTDKEVLLETSPATSLTSSDNSSDSSHGPSRESPKHWVRRTTRKPPSPIPDTEVPTTLKAMVTYRLGRIRNNKLLFILCLVGATSLVVTVCTNRVVLAFTPPMNMDPDDLEDALNRYEPNRSTEIRRPQVPPASGLRGSLVHSAGRYKPEHLHLVVNPESRHNQNPGEKVGGNVARETMKKIKKAVTPTKTKQVERVLVTPNDKQAGSNEILTNDPAVKAAATEYSPEPLKRLAVVAPIRSLNVKSSFDEMDKSLYMSDIQRNGENRPRILSLHEPLSDGSLPKRHRVDLFPADYTDSTQLYSILDSSDERLSKMERREPYSDEHCVPMQDWQTTYHPSCNGMHELAMAHVGGDVENDINLFGTKGYWRNAWRLDVLSGNHGKDNQETVVLKTLKFQHNFEDAHFEHDRIDAVAMERLTSSPHVINVFGFCGHSVISEYADGSRVGELADKSKNKPLARLKIARDVATGLADVHGIDGDGNATFVHLDINPANVVSVGGTLKLNDFNVGIILRWNTTSNQHCGFPAQYPNPQWRSPEEARNEQDLTEKVDIFSLGHIFFRLICGHEPWNKLEPGGKPSKEEINEKVQRGVLPFIPADILNTKDKEVAAIRDAMLRCYAVDPSKRPSAREIANDLQSTLDALSGRKTSAALTS